MQKISLIPYSCGSGAKNKTCADGPEVLCKYGLAEKLQKIGLEAEWLEDTGRLAKNNESDSDIKNIAKYCTHIKTQVQDALRSDRFPITIGGDHSMAIGTWSGVADVLYSRRKLGLIWVDAHMDSHTADSSHTGNYHGMPMSYLLGFGDDILADIAGRGPVIVPYQLCLVGVRSYEPEEAAFLDKMGVKVFSMEQIRQKGIDDIMLEAIKIASAHTAGFGISIDIDAFDPKIAPGTGTHEKHGILKDEFIEATKAALSGYRDKLLALEIAEYNPHMDKNHITADLVTDIISAVLDK